MLVEEKRWEAERAPGTDLVYFGRCLFNIAEGSSAVSLNASAFQSLYNQKIFPRIKLQFSLL